MANIRTLAGLTEPCEVCAPHIQKMRDSSGWVPFRDRFFMCDKLPGFQRDMITYEIDARALQ